MKSTLQAVASVLSESTVKAVLVGGAAVNQYAPTRLTFDVDMVIEEGDEVAFSDALRQQGFERIHRTENFARFKPPAPGFIVDLLFLDSRTFHAMWEMGRDITLAGRSFRIAAPEHLICMKLHALKFGRESRMDRDVADILHMMKQCGWTPDTDEFSAACSQYGTPDLRDLIRRRWTS